MEAWLQQLVSQLLTWLALPEVGLSAVFVVALISATLLPMGSEPAVYALVSVKPELFWPAIAVATLGNTLGGAISWWMGAGAHGAYDHWGKGHPHQPGSHIGQQAAKQGRLHVKALQWLEQFGPKACLLSWLPLVGDPLCAVAGWLRLPFWPCVFYMAIGKFCRYFIMTTALIWAF